MVIKIKININDLFDLVDIINDYLFLTYDDYPQFNETNPRSNGVAAVDYIHDALTEGNPFRRTINTFMQYLDTPLGLEEQAHRKITEYISKIKEDKNKFLEDQTEIHFIIPIWNFIFDDLVNSWAQCIYFITLVW